MSKPFDPTASLYHYKAQVVSVYDGDTIRVFIDQGLGQWNRGLGGKGVSIRFCGIDAPERRGEEKVEGLKARDYLLTLIPPGSEVLIHTVKKGKYGRFLGTIWVRKMVDAENGTWLNVNDLMVHNGHAEYKTY